MFRNKQGKEKEKYKETEFIMVNNLTSYIMTVAVGKSNELDFSMGCLPVCFDADTGCRV